MNPLTDHANLITRRRFLGAAALTLGLPALQSLLGAETSAPLGLRGLPHFAPKAKRVIYMMQTGGPSHVDLFDDKPELRKQRGKDIPESVLGGLRLTTMTAGQKAKPCLPAAWGGSQRGACGMWVSDLLPHTASIADDLTFIRSMHGEQINHAPAVTHMLCGHNLPGRPSIGAWLTYGLGTEAENLPGFVVMTSRDQEASCGQFFYDFYWGAGFLPGKFQGVPFRGAGDPVLYLSNPDGMSRELRRTMLDGLAEMNHFAHERIGDPEIATRISQYEMAFKMQASVPELTDLSTEPQSVLDLQPSQPRPVRVRIASFGADRKRGGGLEKYVFPPVAGSFYRHSIDLSETSEWEGKFDPAAPFIQVSWEIASDAPQPWPKADGHLIRVDNVSFSSPGFYVSASGSDKADGRTEATAFATIRKGIDTAQAGDTVVVMDGVYPLGGGVSFARSGTAAKWITLKGAPGAKPRVEFSGWSGFTVKNGAAFIEINGLEIVGHARNVTLEEAQENGRAEKPDGKFNGTAISIEGRTHDDKGATVKDEAEYRDRADRPHHIRIVGCEIHDACGAGIAGMLADYVTIEGNTVSDCAARSRYAHSGITLYWAWNFDASLEHRNFIRNNIAARNRTMVAWQPRWEPDAAKAFVSDGNGIIIDDFIQHQPGGPSEPNAGRTLVQNNLSHHNGGGIHVFASDRVDVVNNTTFANCQTAIIDYGEIDTSWSKDCRVLNNVAVASPGKTVHRNRNRQNKPEPSNVWKANVLFADGAKKVSDFSEHDIWADPLLVKPDAGAPGTAFALQPDSPAHDFGIDGPLVCGLDLLGVPRPVAGKIDCGAMEAGKRLR